MFEFILNEGAESDFEFPLFAKCLRRLLKDGDYLVIGSESLKLCVADLATAESIDNLWGKPKEGWKFDSGDRSTENNFTSFASLHEEIREMLPFLNLLEPCRELFNMIDLATTMKPKEVGIEMAQKMVRAMRDIVKVFSDNSATIPKWLFDSGTWWLDVSGYGQEFSFNQWFPKENLQSIKASEVVTPETLKYQVLAIISELNETVEIWQFSS